MLKRLKRDKKSGKKEKSEPMLPRFVGQTVGFEHYRRLQLHDILPSDIKAQIDKEHAVAKFEQPKERDWMNMAIAIVVVAFGMAIVLFMLTKVDLGKLFSGLGGEGGRSIIPTAMFLLMKVRGWFR